MEPTTANWTILQKTAFRFFFIYLALYMAPWGWLDYTFTDGPLIPPLQTALYYSDVSASGKANR